MWVERSVADIVCDQIKEFAFSSERVFDLSGYALRIEKNMQEKDFKRIMRAIFASSRIQSVRLGEHSSPGKKDGIEWRFKEADINEALKCKYAIQYQGYSIAAQLEACERVLPEKPTKEVKLSNQYLISVSAKLLDMLSVLDVLDKHTKMGYNLFYCSEDDRDKFKSLCNAFLSIFISRSNDLNFAKCSFQLSYALDKVFWSHDNPTLAYKSVVDRKLAAQIFVQQIGLLTDEYYSEYADRLAFEVDSAMKKVIFTEVIPDLFRNTEGFEVKQAMQAFLFTYRYLGNTNNWNKEDSLAIANSILDIVLSRKGENKISSDLILKALYTAEAIIHNFVMQLESDTSKSTIAELHAMVDVLSKLHKLAGEDQGFCAMLETKIFAVCQLIQKLQANQVSSIISIFKLAPKPQVQTVPQSLFDLREAAKKNASGEYDKRLSDMLGSLQLAPAKAKIKSDYRIIEDYNPSIASAPALSEASDEKLTADSSASQLYPVLGSYAPPVKPPPADAVPVPVSLAMPSAPPMPQPQQRDSSAPPAYEAVVDCASRFPFSGAGQQQPANTCEQVPEPGKANSYTP